jgi:hypothetical protein
MPYAEATSVGGIKQTAAKLRTYYAVASNEIIESTNASAPVRQFLAPPQL